MSTKFGSKLASVTGNLSKLVQVANACDKAYNEGIDFAYGPYEPFGLENPEKVAMNVAGLQAVVSSVGAIAELRGITGKRSNDHEDVLVDIANGELTEFELNLTRRFANATWGASQAFRSDKGALGRATRVNFFDDLPISEVEKDDFQIRAAAQFLIGQLS